MKKNTKKNLVVLSCLGFLALGIFSFNSNLDTQNKVTYVAKESRIPADPIWPTN
ncbi:hypothetical protein ACQKJC_13095 [Priestia koreensis]|uniref:hypothetical protein n=1 Tax=Priestia koreensis TaxID=284581 RepID=UPI003D08342C